MRQPGTTVTPWSHLDGHGRAGAPSCAPEAPAEPVLSRLAQAALEAPGFALYPTTLAHHYHPQVGPGHFPDVGQPLAGR